MDMAHEREASSEEEVMAGELRRGPWTVEEDLLLVNYIAAHGEGRWNSLARSSGLKRTGKSCRLRWLNYLRPDLRRGNITPQEQLLILELHSRWGNRWSKIAQHLPGRTDNEIKNYWRTRVQKHAKQLKCDVNSQQFKDVMRYLWMPRLVERIQATATAAPPPAPDTPAASWHAAAAAEYCPVTGQRLITNLAGPEASSTTGSSSPSMDSAGAQPCGWPAPAAELEGASSFLQCGASTACHNLTQTQTQTPQLDETWSESLPSLGAGYDDIAVSDFEIGSLDVESFLVMDDLWYTLGV